MHGVEKRCWQEGHKSSRGSQQAPTLSSVPQAAVLCFSTPRPTWDRKYAQQLPAFKAALALPIQHSVLLMEPKKQAANISALSSWSKRWERDSSVHFWIYPQPWDTHHGHRDGVGGRAGSHGGWNHVAAIPGTQKDQVIHVLWTMYAGVFCKAHTSRTSLLLDRCTDAVPATAENPTTTVPEVSAHSQQVSLSSSAERLSQATVISM